MILLLLTMLFFLKELMKNSAFSVCLFSFVNFALDGDSALCMSDHENAFCSIDVKLHQSDE